MKIIKLGHYDVKIMCRECQTFYEFSTDEVRKNEKNEWEIRCPICDTPVVMSNNEEIMKILRYKDNEK